MGGSNGGLLVGNMLTHCGPTCSAPIVCQVAAARHAALLTICWPARRGWASTATPTTRRSGRSSRTFSPYQNVKAGVTYPRTLFTTSTRDDRVHPGHARKMVAKMEAQGHDVLYYENIEGGHARRGEQQAAGRTCQSLAYTFFWKELAGASAAARTVP